MEQVHHDPRTNGPRRRTTRRTLRRTRDGRVALRHRNVQAGLTLIELLVTVAMISAVAAIAVPQFTGQRFGLWTAHDQLVQDLRRARIDAITKGDHFEVEIVDDGSYRTWRLDDDDGDGTWTPSGDALRERTLPSGVTFTAGVGATFEFNTRGLMVIPDAADSLVLHDASTGKTRTVTVWPSGQVAPIEVATYGGEG